MIHKVKPPVALTLVHSSHQTKNDLGGQSGEAYSQDQPKKRDPKEAAPQAPSMVTDELEPATSPNESVPIDQQVGLTTVVKDWLESHKAGGQAISSSKLSLKYQGQASTAKGLLLNKKIS